MLEAFAPQLLRKRIYLIVAAHLAIFALSYEVAFRLRFDWAIPADMRQLFWQTILWVLPVKMILFQRFGNLHGWWRYVTFSDLASLLAVAVLSLVVVASVDYFMVPSLQIPRAVLLLDFGTTVMLVGGLRSTWRLLDEHVLPTLQATKGQRPVLLIGAGRQGAALARQIHTNSRHQFRVVGFLDDNRATWGSFLGGIPVLGSPEAAVTLCQERDVRDILMMANSVPVERLRNLLGPYRAAGIQLKVIPRVDELLHGDYRLQPRDVDINDLLGRPPVQLDTAAIAEMIADKCVLVTGAGGSIGSEICRHLLKCRPHSLVMVERAENSLFFIERELVANRNGVQIIPCIADICDAPRMQAIFEQYRPQLVFHCAAHKHVPMMESNPGEAIKNNVLGTVALVDLADEMGVERLVMISTDKAVNPTSVMGVSKHLAERYVHTSSEISKTKFVVVRFGNVLASNGSVVPIFQEQIRRGGPISITHPEMRRYFMSIPEASQLVLQAAAMGKGGEIFVLNMGEPVKIIDLARDLIRLSGLSPEDIEIRVTGVRPGEKLYEELYFDEESTLETHHPDVRVAYHRPDDRDQVLAAIAELQGVVHATPSEIRRRLLEVAPEYRPTFAESSGQPSLVSESAFSLEGI
ncbi:MAG: polysaccharide biosynthesis protein [Aureliella sp.]